MKSKFAIVSLLLAGAAMTVNGQTKEKYVSEKASDNIFVSVTGGISMVNSGKSEGKFGDPAPHITVSLGKWFTPVWGIRAQGGLWKANFDTNHSYGTYDSNGLPVGTEAGYSKNVGQIRLDGLYNLSNAIWGYNPDRVFNLSVFAGPGITIAKTAQGVVDYPTSTTWERVAADDLKGHVYVNGSVGLQGKFNVSKYVDIDVEARGELAASYLGHQSTAKTVGGIYVGAGITYTFGGKKFVPYVSKVDQDAINDEINRYRRELAQAQADLADCRNALANARPPQAKEVVKETEVAGPRAIFFKIGSTRLDDYGKVNIQLAAKSLKANPGKKYKVAGYADKATGSASWNQKLSEQRAKVVYDALIAEGVDKDQLEFVGFGGTENMFGKDYLNRVVILE